MEATIDSVGRIVVPKALRDELGLVPGTKVDVSR
ncbi:MAG: AbrB/MazE/SpoVT family DNA-binding domain-containing protein, partial [Tetrasphaera sp.]|nr:AbrB/MazE/SpoVT family DNA-binding domain-containing protein [Tetrasphaera sp.]